MWASRPLTEHWVGLQTPPGPTGGPLDPPSPLGGPLNPTRTFRWASHPSQISLWASLTNQDLTIPGQPAGTPYTSRPYGKASQHLLGHQEGTQTPP